LIDCAEPLMPSVGIFWRVPADAGGGRLITDSIAVHEGEPYGDCLTYPSSHYDVREEWRLIVRANSKSRDIPRSVVENEYEAFPRGRIVFHQP
jgi:hypothetical protein